MKVRGLFLSVFAAIVLLLAAGRGLSLATWRAAGLASEGYRGGQV